VYLPLAQSAIAPASLSLSLRTASGPPTMLVRPLASAIGAADPDLAMTFRPLSEYLRSSINDERLVAILSGFFGGLALLLAALGVYGVTAYGVSRRRVELGIRVALGADPSSVVRLVLWRVAIVTLAGLVAGGAISLWAGRFVAALLFGLQPQDPLTFLTAALALSATGALAGWLPARRAARIDPAHALRTH
jgi:ABC-type antimicrobial peptide transport system permease subunit